MKKIHYIFLIITLFFLNNCCVFASEIKDLYKHNFDVSAKEIALYNLNDDYLMFDKNMDEKIPIASLTKIMTSIVAIENISNLDETITIKNEYFYGLEGYALAGFKVSDKVTYRDLLYGVMLPSGADAVNAIIFNVSNSKEDFINLMNNKAKELNMTNTHFDNAIGIDSVDNYSTARDLSILLKYALNNKDFKTIFTTRKHNVKSTNLTLTSTLEKYSKNTNLDVSNIKGAKSGFTDGAGVCLASIFSYDDIDYMLVVLGSDATNRSNAIKDSLTIYNYYKDNYSYKKIVTKDKTIKKIPVKLSNTKEYDISYDKDLVLYLPNDINYSDIKYIYDGYDEITYKNKTNSKLGNIKILYKDIELDSFDVYLNTKIHYYYPYIFIVILIFLLVIIKLLFNKKKKRRRRKRKKRNR